MEIFEKLRRQIQDWRFRKFEVRDYIEGFQALEKGLKPSIYSAWHEKDVDFSKFETEKKIFAKSKTFENKVKNFNAMIEKGFPFCRYSRESSNGRKIEVLCICATQEIAEKWKNAFSKNGELNDELIGEMVGYPKFTRDFFAQNPPAKDRLFAEIRQLGIYFAFGKHQIQELRDFLKEKNVAENEIIVKRLNPKRRIWRFDKFLKKKGL